MSLRDLASTIAANVDPYTLSRGRVAAIVAVAIGLAGAVTGGLAVARSTRRKAIAALVLAPIALVLGALVVVTADGGLGTGNGLGGGVVAITVGALGMGLGGIALTRARRAG